jgi:hypothetical protein
MFWGVQMDGVQVIFARYMGYLAVGALALSAMAFAVGVWVFWA